MKIFIVTLALSLLSGSLSWAWGKRGHEIVEAVAARILEEKKGKTFLRPHEFDLGYYANVPDLIWRKTAAKAEPPQHYMDWTKDYAEVFGTPKSLPLEFKDFKAKLGDKFKLNWGVVPYRIHGLIKRCNSLASNLDKDKQGPLLVCLGVLGHYTGDLSMPLHVAENHDGQLTGQKGVHVYFESDLVDQLDPEIKVEVMNKALKVYERSEMLKLKGEEAVRWMISDSYGQIAELLKTDKETSRQNLLKAANKFKPLIISRLVQGAILTAHVWSEILDQVKSFDEDHFVFFDGTPDYIEPGSEL